MNRNYKSIFWFTAVDNSASYWSSYKSEVVGHFVWLSSSRFRRHNFPFRKQAIPFLRHLEIFFSYKQNFLYLIKDQSGCEPLNLEKNGVLGHLSLLYLII